MCTLVTDFSLAYITMSRWQFHALPLKVRELLQWYGREIRDPRAGLDAPSVIEIPRYRIPELEAAMTAEDKDKPLWSIR